MNRSDSIKELATALSKAQGEIENASKNQKNDHFKNKYADLAEVLNTIRPVFSANGLSVAQLPSYEAPMASVETVLMHSSGEFMSSTCSAPVSRADAQGVGSVITYLRRYSLAAMAGISQEDDDAGASGNGAGNGAGTGQQRQRLAQQARWQGLRNIEQREHYSDEQFEANFPVWKKRIANNKATHDDIIATVESKYALTDDQKKKINAIKSPAAAPAAEEAKQ